jgi:hypothetical protein
VCLDSPLVLPNGSVVIAYTDAADGEHIALARSETGVPEAPCSPFHSVCDASDARDASDTRRIINTRFLDVRRADDPLRGPYTKLGPPSQPIFEHHCEDPFLYKGRSGYHVICHDMERAGGADGCRFQGYDSVMGPPHNVNCTGQVGLHAYSSALRGDGSGWQTAPRLAGNATAASAYRCVESPVISRLPRSGNKHIVGGAIVLCAQGWLG